jgi:hypothetical protein
MKIVRNFNDFVKKRINEDVDPIENSTVGNPELKAGIKINWFSETGAFHVDRKKFETVEEVLEYLKVNHGHNATQDAEVEDQSNLIDEPEASYGEEESGEYEGTTKLKQLAKALGAEITNNEINYEGHKHDVKNPEMEPAMESRRFRRNKK